MAKARKNYWSLAQGYVTEASSLTFPEGTTRDERNMTLRRDGARYRRLGQALINDVIYDSSIPVDGNFHINTFMWEFPDNLPANPILVVQIGYWLIFYDAQNLGFDAGGGAGEGGELHRVDVRTIDAGYSGYLGRDPIDMAASNGVLVCVGKLLDKPFYVDFELDAGDPINSTFTYKTFDITVRDTWGVYDADVDNEIGDGVDAEIPTDHRPTTLPITHTHQYNLYNQGWGTTPPALLGNAQSTHANFYETTVQEDNRPGNPGDDWPSNADIVFLGKSPISSDFGTYNSIYIRLTYLGNTPAPKGKAVLRLKHRGEDRRIFADRISANAVAEGENPVNPPNWHYHQVIDLPDDQETGDITTVAFYAGRVFYSGIESRITDGDDRSVLLSGAVLFSQLLETKNNLGRCYQVADPTSEEISDLVATDGGVIYIPDATNIIHLEPLGNNLIVFSQTGIWAIGGSEAGFAADDFQVRKISDTGVLTRSSIINMETAIVYWAQNGIYILQGNTESNILGNYTIESLTQTKIQTYYNNLLTLSKTNAAGFYNPKGQTLSWVYNPLSQGGGDEYDFHWELRFDMTLGSWYLYQYTVNSDTPYIAGFATNTYAIQLSDDDIELDATVYLNIKKDNGNYNLGFSRLTDGAFNDWGYNYNSLLRPGIELLGDGISDLTEVTVKFFFNQTETIYNDQEELIQQSGAMLTARWDFAQDSPVPTDKTFGPVQMYKLQRYTVVQDVDPDVEFAYGRHVVVGTQKLKGKGLSLDLYLESEPGKDMQLLGWSAEYNIDVPQ